MPESFAHSHTTDDFTLLAEKSLAVLGDKKLLESPRLKSNPNVNPLEDSLQSMLIAARKGWEQVEYVLASPDPDGFYSPALLATLKDLKHERDGAITTIKAIIKLVALIIQE